MLLTKIHEVIAWIVTFQAALLSLFIFINTNRKPSKILLAFFLLVIMCIYCNCITGFYYHELYTCFPHIINFFPPFWYLLAPLIYFIIRSMLKVNFRFRTIHVIHAVPFLINAGFFVFLYHIHDAGTKRMILDSQVLKQPDRIMNGFSHVLIFTYLLTAFIQIMRFKQRSKRLRLTTKNEIIHHLNFIVIGYFAVWLFWVSNYISFMVFHKHFEILSLISKCMILFYTATIVWNGLKNPEIFTRFEYNSKVMDILEQQQTELEMKNIIAYINSEKPYLDPYLTISDLASKLSVPVKHLSFLINLVSGKNFCDFINTFRIEESKKLLSENTDAHKTVQEVFYDCGFNSKSAFNTAFKKLTQLTPTEFRRLNNTSPVTKPDFYPAFSE